MLDLGLARLIEAANPFADAGAAGSLTQTGTFMGTADLHGPGAGERLAQRPTTAPTSTAWAARSTSS